MAGSKNSDKLQEIYFFIGDSYEISRQSTCRQINILRYGDSQYIDCLFIDCLLLYLTVFSAMEFVLLVFGYLVFLLVLLVHIVGIFNNFALFHSFVHGFAHIDSFVMTLFLLVPLSTRHSSPARSL